MIRGVIFDLGGTLMRFEGNWEEIDARSSLRLMEYMRNHGMSLGEDFPGRFRAARERGWNIAEEQGIEARIEDALAETLEELGINFALNGSISDIIGVYYKQFEQRWRAYPYAIETLQELRKVSLHAGLISNADSEHIVHTLVEKLGFAPYLDPVLSSASEPRWRKPDPRIFLLVSHKWNVDPAEIAMIGDTVRYDILGAHRAGMRGVLIDHGDGAPWQKVPNEILNDPLIKPDLTIHTLAEIPSVIQQL
jgi:putative hydrolase of the HAD superfamily